MPQRVAMYLCTQKERVTTIGNRPEPQHVAAGVDPRHPIRVYLCGYILAVYKRSEPANGPFIFFWLFLPPLSIAPAGTVHYTTLP